MVDDCGTLIDMQTRDNYDYVSDVVDLLNELHDENKKLKKKIDDNIEEKNEQLKLSNQLLFEKMKEKIPNHPKLQRDLEYLMNEGMSREEALNLMISAWLSNTVE